MSLKRRAIFEGVLVATTVYYMAGSECPKPNATVILHEKHTAAPACCTELGAAPSVMMLNITTYGSISGAMQMTLTASGGPCRGDPGKRQGCSAGHALPPAPCCGSMRFGPC